MLSLPADCPGNRLLNRIELSDWPVLRVHRQQRRLGKEAWPLPPMRLRGMDQERVTQIYRSGIARRRGDWTMGAGGEAVSSELTQCQSRVSCRRELTRDICV